MTHNLRKHKKKRLPWPPPHLPLQSPPLGLLTLLSQKWTCPFTAVKLLLTGEFGSEFLLGATQELRSAWKQKRDSWTNIALYRLPKSEVISYRSVKYKIADVGDSVRITNAPSKEAPSLNWSETGQLSRVLYFTGYQTCGRLSPKRGAAQRRSWSSECLKRKTVAWQNIHRHLVHWSTNPFAVFLFLEPNFTG